MFERIDPKELSDALYDWPGTEREKRGVIAIDGKTIRGSANGKHKAYHVVSAFVAENEITLGELAAAEKSNEITAVPELLDLIDVKGGIVTADAMSCQKEIAKKIREKKADYVLALKENQPALLADVKLWFDNETPSQPVTTRDKGHGRIETREYFLEADIGRLSQKPMWSGLAAIGAARSAVVENGEKRVFTRYFISSLTDINEFAHAARSHWSIESRLH